MAYGKFSIRPELHEPEVKTPNPVLLFLKYFFGRFDLMQILPMLALLTVGALFVYGTGQQVGGIHAEVFWKRHLYYMGFGGSLWFILSFIDYRWLSPASFVIYPISIILLVVVLIYGDMMFGARRWLTIGSISFQPSEIAKLSLLLSTAAILALKKADVNKLLWAGIIFFITLIPFILILNEPDLGTALILLPLVGAIVFTARLKWYYIVIILIGVSVCTPVVYHFLKPYQKERIQVFLDPERDPRNRGWNQLQAEMAVGSGGLTGKGFMQGMHCTLEYLPRTVANSDFIFPVIAEETGLVGTLFIVLMYAVLIFSILRTGLLAPDPLGCYLCVGIAALIMAQTAVNIGMCIRIAPVTGIPLPLISYGGTSLVMMLVYMGIVQSVYAHRKREPLLDF